MVGTGHDLVISGTRRFGHFRSMIIGSTGMKLLRHCPCPVWLTEPQSKKIQSILVAHDLKPVGDLAMKFGCDLASALKAQLHVFHSIESPEMDTFLPGSTISSKDIEKYRSTATQHISKQLGANGVADNAEIHLDYGPAYSSIYNMIGQKGIDLLVLGTVSRSGILGIIGNTAENLLPHVKCSILAVKPEDFKSST